MYAKVFKSMFEGSLRGQSDALLVFVNLLANSDLEGYVDRHFQAIADETGLSLNRVKAAIELLESPDIQSRSKELDGRRLERIDEHRDWGWRVVNYRYYRSLAREYERREYLREKQSERRESLRQRVSTPVNISLHCQPIAEADAEADAEASFLSTLAQTDGAKSPNDLAFDEFWKAYPKKSAKQDALKAFRKLNCRAFLPKIIESLKQHKQCRQWIEEDGRFIPYPATWLNRQSWNDEVEVSTGKSSVLTNADKVRYSQELDRARDRMRVIKNQYGEMQKWTSDDIEEFKRLKKRKHELMELLGVKV